MGAPLGNRNAYKHGARSNSHPYLPFASWGPEYETLRKQIARYVRRLRALVKDKHGRLTHTAEEQINLAARYEMAARLTQRALASDPKMSADARLSHVMKLTAFTLERSRAVAKLKLDDTATSRADDDPASDYLEDPADDRGSDTEAAGDDAGDGDGLESAGPPP